MNLNRFKILQYAKVGMLFGILIAIGAYIHISQPAGEQSILLITSLIAISPVILSGYWNALKRPHVVLTRTEIVDFPRIVYEIDSGNAQGFNNGICLRAHVKNIGFETAIDCECESEEQTLQEKYSSRWSIGGSNPTNYSLSPNEEQFVDLFWYDYHSGKISVPTRIETEEDHGGTYKQSEPAILNNLDQGNFKILIRASNMGERSDELSILNQNDVNLSKILIRLKEYNPFTKSAINLGNYAFVYNINGGWVLHINEGLELSKLKDMAIIGDLLFEDGDLKSLDQTVVTVIENCTD